MRVHCSRYSSEYCTRCRGGWEKWPESILEAISRSFHENELVGLDISSEFAFEGACRRILRHMCQISCVAVFLKGRLRIEFRLRIAAELEMLPNFVSSFENYSEMSTREVMSF